uniref:Uncharacterized protein n=1 Tax=Anguilla anguilla TaxID=7936 RepID=A0A0E9PVK3_ANGAN
MSPPLNSTNHTDVSMTSLMVPLHFTQY